MPMPFSSLRLEVPELILITPRRFEDERGWFMERFKQSEFSALGIEDTFVQDNVSYSSYGVLRGLHFQIAPAAQAKLVTVLQGEIFDVAVDLRPDSASYGVWSGATLTAAHGETLYIPAGFAHGFLVTSPDALVFYKCSAEYNPQCERGIAWNDPTIGIRWPIENPTVSEKDKKFPLLRERPSEVVT